MKKQLTPLEKMAARVFAQIGGRSKSAKKAASSRRNGKLGGRPRKKDKNKSKKI